MKPNSIYRLPSLVLILVVSLASSGFRPYASPTAGGTFVVNSPLDEVDADPSNGSCVSTPSGKCTLRAAIMASNFASDPNTITLPAGVYLLNRVGYDDQALVGDLDITQPLAILGAGAASSIVDGDGAVSGNRVFQILQSAETVTLQGLTIRNGSPLSGVNEISWGGGILINNVSATSLTLDLKDVVLQGNQAETGGGIYASTSRVSLQNTAVYSNTALSGGTGGGIYAAFGSSLAVLDSQLYNNHANSGAGVYLEGMQDAQIEGSQIYSNTAEANGAGVYNVHDFAFPASPLSVVDSSLHDNRAGVDGGGIYTTSSLALTRSVVNANHALTKGGGVKLVPGSGSTLRIQDSTLSRNTAQFGGALEIDGPPDVGADQYIQNSTLSGNSVNGDGAGIYANSGAKVTLYNTTIANNALLRPHGQLGLLRGGGIFTADTALVSLQNSLIADNFYTNNLTTLTPDDCFTTSTSLNSLGYNLVETTSACAIGNVTFGNITGMDPHLAPLGNYLGPTQTQALLAGSPAIDAAQFLNSSCTANGGSALTTDQRGLARPSGPHCDIGAFEYQALYSSFLPFVHK